MAVQKPHGKKKPKGQPPNGADVAPVKALEPKVRRVLPLDAIPTGPPEVRRLSRHHGKVKDQITIEGDNFEQGCDVLFGQASAKPFIDYGAVPGRLVARVPPRDPSDSNPVDVTVKTEDNGQSLPNPNDLFQYDDVSAEATGLSLLGTPGTVDGSSPNHCTTAGGATIVIAGTNLPGPTAPGKKPRVFFGTAESPNVSAFSGSSITCASPGQSAGQVEVSVTDDMLGNRTSPNQPWDMFTYADPPTVTGMSPTCGGPGCAVMISGTNFTGTTAVNFGATPATQFTIQCSTIIGAQAPSNSSGPCDITVVNPAGTSPINRPGDQFNYG